MRSVLIFGVLLVSLLPRTSLASLEDKYSFKSVLHNRDDKMFILHWKFDVEEETITFAVNVSTPGWVGLGLSPNGGMIDSDVVIGWVKDGQPYFHDRYAVAESLPTIDSSQDWELISGSEESGWTTLEFTRKWITCDPEDRDIQENTARVIYSWNDADPASADSVLQHSERSSVSLNLLGGLQNRPADPEGLQSFKFASDDVLIPHEVDTTYWCVKKELPEDVTSQTRYVTRYAVDVSAGSEKYVHHMLIYLCPLQPSEVELKGHCEAVDGQATSISDATEACRAGVLIASWAIGGEDFVYPEDVAYPIGGPGQPRFLLLEVHYDNPELTRGVRDSSGIVFYYTQQRRAHDAGITTIGHDILPFMLVPPNAKEYVISAECSATCTDAFFPKEGIKIFANFLHTHLIGRRAELQHFRRDTECEGGYRELKPIEDNPSYDFDYQQTNFLTHEILVMPGDVLVLKCTYNSDRDEVTLGGYSTHEEMCLSFPAYYPAITMGICGSRLSEWDKILEKYADEFVTDANQRAQIQALQITSPPEEFKSALNPGPWNQKAVEMMQTLVSGGTQDMFCINSTNPRVPQGLLNHPRVSVAANCRYEAPDLCSSGGLASASASEMCLLAATLLCCLAYNLLSFLTYNI